MKERQEDFRKNALLQIRKSSRLLLRKLYFLCILSGVLNSVHKPFQVQNP